MTSSFKMCCSSLRSILLRALPRSALWPPRKPLQDRFLVSADGQATIVNAVLQLAADIPAVSVQTKDKADEVRAELLAAFPEHNVELPGVVILSALFETAGQADSQTLIALVYALILVVILAAWILITLGLWSALLGTVGFSVAAAGAVGLVVGFTTHFLSKHLRATRGKGRTVAVGIPYAFDTAETATLLGAGVAVLVTSSFKFNADLGLLTAMANVMAMHVNLFLLPSLLVLGNRKAPSLTATLKEAS